MSPISTTLQRVMDTKERVTDTLDRATIAIITAPFKAYAQFYTPVDTAILLAIVLAQLGYWLFGRLFQVADFVLYNLTDTCMLLGGAKSSCGSWAQYPSFLMAYSSLVAVQLSAMLAATCLYIWHCEIKGGAVRFDARDWRWTFAWLTGGLIAAALVIAALFFGLHLEMPGKATGAEIGNDLSRSTSLSNWQDAYGIQSEFRRYHGSVPHSDHDCLLDQYQNDTAYSPCD